MFLTKVNRMRLVFIFFCMLTIWTDTVLAASPAQVIDGLKKMNTDMCVQMGSNVPDAPKNPKLVAPYCGCVSEVYWQSVPTAEQQELATKGTSLSVQNKADACIAPAQKACKKKIGF